MASPARIEYGDWQTPIALADAVTDKLAHLLSVTPRTVVEPTCGVGAFLQAASNKFPKALLRGFDINPDYVAQASNLVPPGRSEILTTDFFAMNWEQELSHLPDPLLIIGNPPWVTSAQLGSLASINLPKKENFKKLGGLEALTGKSNFDVSEWMLLRLMAAIQSRDATVAVLCKTAVARRVIEFVCQRNWRIVPVGLWRIDSLRHFDASVDAVLFVCRVGDRPSKSTTWPVFNDLASVTPEMHLGFIDGILVSDVLAYERTRHLAGSSSIEWRSGVKHDCSRVAELDCGDGRLTNGFGDVVDIEDDYLYPFLKSSDVANGRLDAPRQVILTQTALGEDTSPIRDRAPKTWAYLNKHKALFEARKSSIYKSQPPFAMFGVGPYTLAPWKVAISGMYKRLEFALLGPRNGRPVLLDDTCYFAPFSSERTARAALSALRSPIVRDYFEARVFWDAKRPINKSLLQSLDLQALLPASDVETRSNTPKQQLLSF
ncbi:MAG: SAM-dependent methyltransferase [Byssovorax sp.]